MTVIPSHGVAFGREELDVVSTTKLTVMNGGQMEPSYANSMQYLPSVLITISKLFEHYVYHMFFSILMLLFGS